MLDGCVWKETENNVFRNNFSQADTTLDVSSHNMYEAVKPRVECVN